MESPFPNINLHVVDDSPFVGVRMKTEKDKDFIDKAKQRSQELKRLMRPSPASCVVEAIGKRPTMEDFHVCKDVVILPEGKLNVSHISYYAIYDGHGGTDCAEFLSNVLFQVIIQNVVETPNDVEGAMRKAFEDCDKAIVSKLGNDGLSVGSTAVVVLLLDRTLYCANVGDAEAFIGRKDMTKGEFARPLALTQVHKVSLPEEKARIESVGGKIFAGRLFGTLAISRAFGDGEMKVPKQEANYVSCVPFIKKMELNADDEFLVLACDGLWDKVTHEEASLFVSKLLHHKTLEHAAEFLLEEALDRNTKDNVTVIVVNLGWSVELGADVGTAELDNLSPAFVQFLQKTELLPSVEEFHSSAVRGRISSPIIHPSARKKDFYIRKVSTGSTDLPSSVSVDEEERNVVSIPAKETAVRDLMIDIDESDEEGGSYEIGATPHSMEIPKDVLDRNDQSVREATLAAMVAEEERKRLEQEEERKRLEQEEEEEIQRNIDLEHQRLKEQQLRIEEEQRRIRETLPKDVEEEQGSDFESGVSVDSHERKRVQSDDDEQEESSSSSEVALAGPGAFS